MWLELLKTAIKESSKQAVARELDVSRTTISLVADGKYPASTDKIAALVLERYGRVVCPHTDQEITLVQCRSNHQSAVPTSSPQAMKQWRACQKCPNNSNGGSHE